MPQAPIGEDGLQFYYEDTGAPAGMDNYKTWVLIHGGVFHSGKHSCLLKSLSE